MTTLLKFLSFLRNPGVPYLLFPHTTSDLVTYYMIYLDLLLLLSHNIGSPRTGFGGLFQFGFFFIDMSSMPKINGHIAGARCQFVK